MSPDNSSLCKDGRQASGRHLNYRHYGDKKKESRMSYGGRFFL